MLYNQGLGYSALNTARCALSSFVLPVNNITFGAQPLVIRFMKGIYQQRPSVPRYEHIWDVSVEHIGMFELFKNFVSSERTIT
jgi:hypothetical protein